MVPGVAVPQDVLFECESGTETDTQKFHLRKDFEPLTI